MINDAAAELEVAVAGLWKPGFRSVIRTSVHRLLIGGRNRDLFTSRSRGGAEILG
jgi:hypothetical protein